MKSESERLMALDELAAAPAGPARERGLLAGLTDEASVVREHAIALAARHLGPEVLGELLADDVDAVRRNSALAALERQGSYAVPHLIKLAQGPNLEVAMFAVQILSRLGDPSSVGALLPLMEHSDSNIAQAAVEALGNLRVRAAVPGLIKLLGADLWLQFAAVTALGEIGDERAAAPLLEAMENQMLADSSAEALAQLCAPRALGPLLERLLTTDRLPLRDHLLRAVAATLERHPELGAAPGGLRGARAMGSLPAYLAGLLPGEAGDAAGRDAATVALALDLRELYPAVVRRVVAQGDPDADVDIEIDSLIDDGGDEALRLAALGARWHTLGSPAVLATLLGDADATVRRGALSCASFTAASGSDGTLEALLARLEDRDTGVRAAACRALGRLAEAAPDAPGLERAAGELIARLPAGIHSGQVLHPAEHAAAVEALGRLPAGHLGGLRPALASGEPTRVAAALAALERARGAPLAAEVQALLGSPMVVLRKAALPVVAELPGPEAEALLIERLGDSDDGVRIDAISALVRRGAVAAATPLLELLIDDAVRYHVIRALGRLRAPAAAARLCELFPAARPHERIEIVAALGRIGGPLALDFLRARLGEADTELRRVAADGIARLASPEVLPLLLTLAGDPDWNIRNHAGWGLGQLPDSDAVRAALVALARDVEPVVARTARGALARLEPVG